ncbi:hypothetical protein P3T40_003409 [Paraburkholderia sp. EB58]|uniref:hypothetical protein n=1 Tax=Paraburkholderia sp. EB58 TaxID=3035125 RepID=UPI003D1C625F
MKFTHQANPVRVNAKRIVELEERDDYSMDVRLDEGNGQFSAQHLTNVMLSRYKPVIGDYVVTQEDFYVYVNPKDVFERKYSAID